MADSLRESASAPRRKLNPICADSLLEAVHGQYLSLYAAHILCDTGARDDARSAVAGFFATLNNGRLPSDVPSDAPSDVPSDAIGDAPGDAPSDAPSDAKFTAAIAELVKLFEPASAFERLTTGDVDLDLCVSIAALRYTEPEHRALVEFVLAEGIARSGDPVFAKLAAKLTGIAAH